MPLPIRHVIGILADNLRLRGSVMPLSRARLTGWAAGLGLPRGGEQVLYTGHLYQMMPSLASLEAMLALAEKTPLIKLMGLGRLANRFLNLSAFMSWPSAASQRAYDGRLRNIARCLQQAGEPFGYLYGQELYSGALIYDLGVDEVFRPHAARVWKRLQDQGVKRVITVDPHTTEMLREIFPRVVPGFRLDVRSYLEVLAQRGWKAGAATEPQVALHDSCVYARGLNLIEPMRRVLKNAGVAVRTPQESGVLTHCCGGPAESLYPEKAAAVAKARIAQLAASQAPVAAVACPICLHNLDKAGRQAGLKVRDLSEILQA